MMFLKVAIVVLTGFIGPIAALGQTLVGQSDVLKCGESNEGEYEIPALSGDPGPLDTNRTYAQLRASDNCKAKLRGEGLQRAGEVTCDDTDCYFWQGCSGARTISLTKFKILSEEVEIRSVSSSYDCNSQVDRLAGIICTLAATTYYRYTISCEGTVKVEKSCSSCKLCPGEGGDIYTHSTGSIVVQRSTSSNRSPEAAAICEVTGGDEETAQLLIGEILE